MLAFLEVCLVMFFILFIFKQVIIPKWNGERTFPMFRKKRKQLEGKRAEAVETLLDAEMQVEIEELREQTKKVKENK